MAVALQVVFLPTVSSLQPPVRPTSAAAACWFVVLLLPVYPLSNHDPVTPTPLPALLTLHSAEPLPIAIFPYCLTKTKSRFRPTIPSPLELRERASHGSWNQEQAVRPCRSGSRAMYYHSWDPAPLVLNSVIPGSSGMPALQVASAIGAGPPCSNPPCERLPGATVWHGVSPRR